VRFGEVREAGERMKINLIGLKVKEVIETSDNIVVVFEKKKKRTKIKRVYNTENMGRPSYPDDLKQAAIKLFEENPKMSGAKVAKKINKERGTKINRNTVYKWIAQKKEQKDIITDSQGNLTYI